MFDREKMNICEEFLQNFSREKRLDCIEKCEEFFYTKSTEFY